MTIKIAPSILSADFTKLGEEIRAVEKAGADWIHIDVMDGRFVPNITIGPLVVKAARRATSLPLDVHLMIEEPERHVQSFREAGADMITVHIEASTHLHRTVAQIRESGAKAGVSLNPATSLTTLDSIITDVDMVLVMTVNPGFAGQELIEHGLVKVSMIRKVIEELSLNVLVEVDGGIKASNIERAAAAGADVFVAGSSVYGSGNYKKAVAELRKNALKAESRKP